MEPVKPKPRTIAVTWTCDGELQHERRVVHFATGFGHYVRWNRRAVLVDPLQDELILGEPGPRAHG